MALFLSWLIFEPDECTTEKLDFVTQDSAVRDFEIESKISEIQEFSAKKRYNKDIYQHNCVIYFGWTLLAHEFSTWIQDLNLILKRELE